MQLSYNDKEYDIVIEKKKSNKNTYIRVKKDLKIHVTTNYFVSMFSIKKLIRENYDRICRMIDFQETKVKNNNGFYYLGKQYVVIYIDGVDISFSGDKVYIGNSFDIDKWYKVQAKALFLERLDYNYNNFTRKIPYPKLRIRKMTSRWGVCNIRNHNVTLNYQLSKYQMCCLDYVIVHELSHFIYPNHSRDFWSLVGKYYPNYKECRKMLKG